MIENSTMPFRYAFLAGLIEGDGSIFLRAHKDTRKTRGVTFGMNVKVMNTKKELTDFLASVYGGNASNGYQPRDKSKSKIYEWTIGSKNAKKLLENIYPYLITKRQQALLAIQFQDLLDISHGYVYTSLEYKERVAMVKRMHGLNAKEKDKTWLEL